MSVRLAILIVRLIEEWELVLVVSLATYLCTKFL
jgi:hypothetical protein